MLELSWVGIAPGGRISSSHGSNVLLLLAKQDATVNLITGNSGRGKTSQIATAVVQIE